MGRALPTKITLPIIFGVAFATGFTGAVVPGSLLAVVVSQTLRVGWYAGPVMMIGHALLELLAVILLATGLIYFARSRWVQGGIGLLGGVRAGLSGLPHLRRLGHAGGGRACTAGLARRPAPAAGLLSLVGLGAVMSVVNPYWWLWWATLCPAHLTWAMRQRARGRRALLCRPHPLRYHLV